ncbi:MAG: carboxypeptidase regulatory-like domain-containing protein [Candidatus Altiarchaeota archaeon]|nr:carboxypeptidase regulatory-like domain-containing protein [Candidatus Altiarchaeota archaeon]
MKPIISHILWIGIFTLLVWGFLAPLVDAAFDIGMDIELSDTEIDAGDSFNVRINITNKDDEDIETSDDIRITIEADGDVVHYDIENRNIPENTSEIISISSSNFKTDEGEDIWGESLMGYECGSISLKVTVSGDVKSSSDSETVKIVGDKLYVAMEPENPTTGKNIGVQVEDENGDPLDDIYVRIVRLGDAGWDIDDVKREKKTDNGEATFDAVDEDFRFKDDPYGKYQLSVWEDGYCLYRKAFEVTNKLKITEAPENPYAGDEIKVKILDINDNRVEGARVAVSGVGGLVGSYNSDSSGYAKFKLESQGSYTLLASKTGYEDSDIVSITVKDRRGMDVRIDPIKQAIGQDVSITITSGGNPIENAEVMIEKPDGSKDTLSTSSTGKMVYKPSMSGTYDITVKKQGYETTTSSFIAMNFFNVSVPEKLELKDEVTITVRNQDGRNIEGASVEIVGSIINGLTDSAGKFSFILDNVGEYVLSIKKEGYEDYSEKLTFYGSLTVRVTPEVIDLGDSVEIRVLDEEGREIDVDMVIEKPDGRKENIKGSTHTLTPNLAGSYNVTANKRYYTPSTADFTVNPYQLDLNVWVSGSNLMIKATRNNEPVGNISVSVLTPDDDEIFLKTDEEGVARLNIRELNQTGTFTISSVDINYEKKTVTREITGAGENLLPLLLLIILVVVLLIILISLTLYISHKSKRSALPSEKTKKTKGGGLGRL